MQGIYYESSLAQYFEDKINTKNKRTNYKLSSSKSHKSVANKSVTNKLNKSNINISSKSNMDVDIFSQYQNKLRRKKKHRSSSMNSSLRTKLYQIEKKRITTDKFSRLFHDILRTCTQTKNDQIFIIKLNELNKNKKLNKIKSYKYIESYFLKILNKNTSNHILSELITKFCNLFHGQYSFSPQDFKNKSIYQIVDQRKNSKKTKDIFNIKNNQSKVIRKTTKRLNRAIEDVKFFIKKFTNLILTLYEPLRALKTYKYVVQSVFHAELFNQLTPTLGDLYSIKTEDKQKEFAKFMGKWKNLSCKDFGANSDFIQFCLIPDKRPKLLSETPKYINDINDNTNTSTSSNLSKQLVNHSNDNNDNSNDNVDEYKDNSYEYQDNFALSQLLHNQPLINNDVDNSNSNMNCAANDNTNDNHANTNIERPDYIPEYDIDNDDFDQLIDDDDDDDIDIDILDDYSGDYSDNDSNNILSILSPTTSSLSLSSDMNSSPDIHHNNTSTIANGTGNGSPIANGTDAGAGNENIKPKNRNRISSLFPLFSSKNKNKNKNKNKIKLKRSNSASNSYENNQKNKHKNMKKISSLINNNSNINRKNKIYRQPQQYLITKKQQIIAISTKNNSSPKVVSPKIDISSSQHQHQHGHINSKKIIIKNNIDNITKQMLAGSHAERIVNKLHRRSTTATATSTTATTAATVGGTGAGTVNNNIKSIKINVNKKLNVINESASASASKSLSVDDDNDMLSDGDDIDDIDDDDDNYNPYLAATLEIRKMLQYSTPEDKIQCVVRTADIIRERIDEYYLDRRIDAIQITPDDLLSLFAYILTKANLHSLWAEVDMIDDFVVDNLRMDMPGYYIATLRAAMQLIVNDIDKLNEKSNIIELQKKKKKKLQLKKLKQNKLL